MSKGASKCTCSGKSAAVESDPSALAGLAESGGSVAVRVLREPTSLLSLVDSDPIVEGMINHAVLETLVRIGDDGETVIPELAESFEVDEINHRYTFHLADNAKWHDGRPVTSLDVRFVFAKLADPFNPFPLTGIFTNIADIDTPDENTVVFTLDKRMPGFFEAVAVVPILPMHVFGRTPFSLHEASRGPIGSGPYRFVRWVPSQFVELERNPEWRGSAPFIDEVRYVFVPDNRIAMDMFAHGDLDILWDYPTGGHPPNEDARVITFPLPFLETWLYNNRRAMFEERNVRHAISMLIDNETIRCGALECQADLPAETLSASNPYRMVFKAGVFNPKAAAKLLDDAGWKKSDARGIRTKMGHTLSFSLLMPNLGRNSERAAVIIQEDLAEAGIDMEISVVSRGAFMGRLNAGRFDAAAIPLALGGQDAVPLLFHSEEGSLVGFGGAADPAIDELLDRLRAELSLEKQNVIRREIASRLTALHPASYLYRSYGAALVRNTFSGIHIKDGWIDVTELFRRGGR